MSKIRWTDLPLSLRQHLFDRVADRQITAEDLYKLKLWRESEPEAPDGPWYKDFGSFKICGEGECSEDLPLEGTAGEGQGSLPNSPSPARGRLMKCPACRHQNPAQAISCLEFEARP